MCLETQHHGDILVQRHCPQHFVATTVCDIQRPVLPMPCTVGHSQQCKGLISYSLLSFLDDLRVVFICLFLSANPPSIQRVCNFQRLRVTRALRLSVYLGLREACGGQDWAATTGEERAKVTVSAISFSLCSSFLL